jgi:hypothetical protein
MTTLTEVYPCFFLSYKANARVKPAKTGHGPHFSKLLSCSMYCLFFVVLCIVCVYVCTELLPLGGYPIAVKYIISYNQQMHNRGCYLFSSLLHCYMFRYVNFITGQSLCMLVLLSLLKINLFLYTNVTIRSKIKTSQDILQQAG